MNVRRVRALARKEFIQIVRDRRSLALALAIPMMLLVLFGYALTLDVDNVPMVLWDRDNSQVSKNFILNFSNSRYFQLVGAGETYAALVGDLDSRRALIAMVIPKDFSRLIESNKEAPVQFLMDGSDSNTAMIARGYLAGVVSRYNELLMRRGLTGAGGGAVNPDPVSFRPRPWFNPNFESRLYIIPGLIVVIIMIISALLTSLTVAREWERGTMEQLIATPVTPAELILGKFIPYFAIGFFDLLLSVAMAKFVFEVPVRGSLALLFGISALFLTGALTQGIFISIAARSQLLASQLAMLTTFMPTFLLSGFMYPIWNMPKAVQAVTYFVPARYFIVVLRGIYLKGVGIRDLWPQAVFLSVFAVVAAAAANRKFKKKVV